MSITLDQINVLFKQRFADKTTETILETPYFLTNVQTVKVSKEYTVPINLKPGHSMRYAQNPFEKVPYREYSGPHIKEAKGTITAKFFKIEVPLGVIDALNKNNGRDSLAYETARYFIDDAVKTNQLLAELSFMYGETGLPSIIENSDEFLGQKLAAEQLALVYDERSTSDAILRIINNSKTWAIDGTGQTHGSNTPEDEYQITNIDFKEKKILLNSRRNSITNLKKLTSFRLAVATQPFNDNIGLYQLMNERGEVLGIDDREYTNWQPSTYDCENSPLTIKKIKEAASSLITRGGVMDEPLYLYVSQETWDNLSDEFEERRRLDYSYNDQKATSGQRTVSIVHSNGEINVVYHPLMKRGMGFLMTNPKSGNNLINLTTDSIMEFENDKNFSASENSSSAYVIGKMYFSPFMRDRRRHLLIKNIENSN